MSIDCTLTALESIQRANDDILRFVCAPFALFAYWPTHTTVKRIILRSKKMLSESISQKTTNINDYILLNENNSENKCALFIYFAGM